VSAQRTLVNVIGIVVSQFAEGLKSANRQAWTIENKVTARVFNG
jgi:hypothetical protein